MTFEEHVEDVFSREVVFDGQVMTVRELHRLFRNCQTPNADALVREWLNDNYPDWYTPRRV